MIGLYPVVTPSTKDLIFKHFRLKQIMTSVFYLRKQEKNGKIHRVFPLCEKVFLDSGIFQMYKRNLNLRIIHEYRRTLIELYNKLQPDLASALDVPCTIWNDVKTKQKRLSWSLKNYKYLRNRVDDSVTLVPGICAFSEKSARIVANQIKKVVGLPRYLGIGGQVPLLKVAEKIPNLGFLTMKVASVFREEFPEAKIHVFGAGGHRWYMLLRLLGLDSADYAGYLFSTGMGEIILPGIRPKYILKEVILRTKRGKKKYKRDPKKIFSEDEFNEFYLCNCPVCRNTSPVILEFNKDQRMLHNFAVVMSEARIVDEFCKRNDFKGLKSHIRRRILKRDSGIKEITRKTLKMVDENNFIFPK